MKYLLAFVLVVACSRAEVTVNDGSVLALSCDTYDDTILSARDFYRDYKNVTSDDYNRNNDYADSYNRLYTLYFRQTLLRSVKRNFFPRSYEVALKFYIPGYRWSGYGASPSSFSDAYQFASYAIVHCYNSTLTSENETQ